MDLPAILLPNAEQVRLDSLTVASASQTLILTLTTTQTTCFCPLCGIAANRVHSHYTRTLRDLPWAGVTVELRLRVRTFFCDVPECPRRIFTERLPTVVAPRARATVRFAVAQQRIGLALGGAAGERLALDLAFPSGSDSLLSSVRAAPLPSTLPPEQIGIDDWAKRKGQTYATIIVDLTTRQPIDLLPERSAESVAAWLQTHPTVKLISRDRASLYAEGARQGAPDAIQVADRWHILKNLGEAVLQVLQHHHHAISQALTPTAPAARPTPATASPPAALPARLSRTERERHQRRERRQARYDAIQQFHQQGWTIRAIARHLQLERKTVRTYLHSPSCPEPQRRPHRSSLLDPYKAYLLERWDAGCQNAMQLLREIEDQGFRGKRSIVRAFVTQIRKAQGLPPRTRSGGVSGATSDPTLRPPTPRNLTWSIIRRPEKREAREQRDLELLAQVHSDIEQTMTLAQDFAALLRERRGEELDDWLARARTSGISALRRFAASLHQDYAAVKAAAVLAQSNGPTEGNINRLKLLKRQMYGRAKFDLLRQRVLAT